MFWQKKKFHEQITRKIEVFKLLKENLFNKIFKLGTKFKLQLFEKVEVFFYVFWNQILKKWKISRLPINFWKNFTNSCQLHNFPCDLLD